MTTASSAVDCVLSMDCVLSVPWLEEIVIIASVAMAFILTHKIGVSSVRQHGKGCKVPGGKCFLEQEDDDDKQYPRYTVRPKARAACKSYELANPKETGVSSAPQTTVAMPGVTDARFTGRIVTYRPDDGYGFISCPELFLHFRRDVFLHRYQIGSFKVGETVAFGVFLNKAGQPQAKDLFAVVASSSPAPPATAEEEWSPSTIAYGPLVQRAPLNPNAKPFKSQGSPNTEVAGSCHLLQDQVLSYLKEETDEPKVGADAPWTDSGDWSWGWPDESLPDAKASGEKKWVPKASSAGAGKQGKLQWVPKKVGAA